MMDQVSKVLVHIVCSSRLDGAWEQRQIGELVLLMAKVHFGSSRKRVFAFISHIIEQLRVRSAGRPYDILSCEFFDGLSDNGVGIKLQAKQILKLVGLESSNIEEQLEKISELVGGSYLDVHDDRTLRRIVSSTKKMKFLDVCSLAATLCDSSEPATMHLCGTILSSFKNKWDATTFYKMIQIVVDMPFFLDLDGDDKDFYEAFPEANGKVRLNNRNIGQDSMEDSDSSADENGNLRGFIVDSSEEEDIHSTRDNTKQKRSRQDSSESIGKSIVDVFGRKKKSIVCGRIKRRRVLSESSVDSD